MIEKMFQQQPQRPLEVPVALTPALHRRHLGRGPQLALVGGAPNSGAHRPASTGTELGARSALDARHRRKDPVKVLLARRRVHLVGSAQDRRKGG